MGSFEVMKMFLNYSDWLYNSMLSKYTTIYCILHTQVNFMSCYLNRVVF